MIEFNHISSWPTGSRYICNPPPTDTDNDTAILVDDLLAVKDLLRDKGWDVAYNDSYKDMLGDNWFSAKKTIDGVVENYIVMCENDRFAKWVNATELCKKLNLLEKKDRITVFQFIVDGVPLF